MASPHNTVYTRVNLASTVAAEIVAGTASMVTRVLGMFLLSAADATVTIQSSSGAAMIGPVALAANGGFVLPPTNVGYCQSAIAGGSIYIQNSTASQLGGVIVTVNE